MSKAQATQVYAGLKLWPDAVVARLAEAQLVADGTYPNAAAVFAEAEAAGRRPTLDYEPAQPRDVGGRWTAGSLGAGREAEIYSLLSTSQTGAAMAGGVAEPPYAGAQTQSAEGPADLAHESPEERLTRILGPTEADLAKTDPAWREHVVKGQVAPTLGSPRLAAAALAFLAYHALQGALQGAASKVSSWFRTAPLQPGPKGSGPPPSEPHDEPPAPTSHGEAGSAALPGFSPVPPVSGPPPSIFIPPILNSIKLETPATTGWQEVSPGLAGSYAKKAEDPSTKDVPDMPGIFGPGPYAGPPIRGGTRSKPTADQQRRINAEGALRGCHRCGRSTSGLKGEKWIGDHQDPKALTPQGGTYDFYPHCKVCSDEQGGRVRAVTQRRRKS